MRFKWESGKERLLRFMKISPLEKMKWLKDMNVFTAKYLSKKTKKIRQRLKEAR
ncbi:MAG: hypothetical protein ISS26_06605 [Candidatus Omnitrophica bacterium]|nr:hypothetical protein [Candidatus Omnitrophota bacterium]